MAKESMARYYLECLAEWPKGLPFMHMAVLLLLWNNGQQASKKTCFGLFFWLSLGLWGNGFCIYSIGWPTSLKQAKKTCFGFFSWLCLGLWGNGFCK